eukprot:gene14346-20340_t
MRLLLLAAALLLLPHSALSAAVPSYLVIGQQKCGTSTLWSLMKTHPQLEKGSMGGDVKEQRFFQRLHVYKWGDMTDRCDRNPTKYLNLWPDLGKGELAGDFTPAHLSCHCCPELFHTMIPQAKLIAILREPVSRATSRFIEQYNWPFPIEGILTKIVQKFDDFGDFMGTEVPELQKCMKAMDDLPTGGNTTALKNLIEFRCLAKSNTIGWSAYSVYLKRWLEFYPQEQLLVLYTSELEKDPLGTLRRIEKFLGLKKDPLGTLRRIEKFLGLKKDPLGTLRRIEKFLGLKEHEYDNELLHTKFNTKARYGWKSGVVETPGGESAKQEEGQGDGSYADVADDDDDEGQKANMKSTIRMQADRQFCIMAKLVGRIRQAVVAQAVVPQLFGRSHIM